MSETALPQLVARAFRPARARLREALAAVEGLTDPVDAWDALEACGLVPTAWRGATARCFPRVEGLETQEREQRLRWAPFLPRGPVPGVVEHAALVAADVEGIEHAERCGLQLVRALEPWGCPQPRTVLWVPTRLEGGSPWLGQYQHQVHDTKPGVWVPDASTWLVTPGGMEPGWRDDAEAVRARLRAARGASRGADADEAVTRILGDWVRASERWEAAVRRDERVSRDPARPLEGRPYRELSNPFAPVLELFACGYAPLPSNEEVLVLAYPI
jgi:hypothetical protein